MSQGPDYYFDKRNISIVAVIQVMMVTLVSLVSLFVAIINQGYHDMNQTLWTLVSIETYMQKMP
jgi:uncharacterized membrane protein